MAVFLAGSHNGGVESRGIKNRDFRPIYGFIMEIIQDRVIVIMER